MDKLETPREALEEYVEVYTELLELSPSVMRIVSDPESLEQNIELIEHVIELSTRFGELTDKYPKLVEEYNNIVENEKCRLVLTSYISKRKKSYLKPSSMRAALLECIRLAFEEPESSAPSTSPRKRGT